MYRTFITTTLICITTSIHAHASGWNFSTIKDDVTLQKSYVASVFSDDSHSKLLMVRCTPEGEKIIALKGDYYGLSTDIKVTLNFDDTDIDTYSTITNVSGKALFFKDEDYFVISRLLKRYKTVKMKIDLKHLGSKRYQFTLNRSTASINPVEKKCP